MAFLITRLPLIRSPVSQFSDVYPTDWAYQALAGLVETYGCVAGYPNGTFRGNRAMTRYEAAAILNACLDRVTEVTDELRRLMAEFESELAILKGRVDGLEAKVGELEATQFSTTTKLKGYTAWTLGAVDSTNPATNNVGQALTANYDLRLALKTSFTGEDMLTTVLRAGNFGDGDGNATSAFGGGLSFLETGYEGGNGTGSVNVGRLFYTFPVGDDLTVTAGPVVRTDDPGMYAGYATYYPADLMLDFFTYGGAWSTNQLGGTGSGLGAVYSIGDSGFSVSGNYVATNGNQSNGGILTNESTFTSSWQLFYDGEFGDGNFLAQLGYAVNRGIGFTMAGPAGIPNSTNWSAAAAWKPADSGIMPSISTGYSVSNDTDDADDLSAWYVGVEWSDAFIAGNSLGTAIGVTPNATADGDTSTLWELFYSMPVTDNITITPAIFTISDNGGTDDAFGGVVKTTFKF